MLQDSIRNATANLSMFLDQNGDEIGFWAGLALMVTGTGVGLYKALKRAPEIKDEYRISNKDLTLKKAINGLSDEAFRAEERVLKRKRNKDYVKAFVIPFVLEAAGVVLEILVHVDMNNKYQIVSTELVATTAAFAGYRMRTEKVVGKDIERAIYYDKELKTMEVEERDENGNVIKTKNITYLEEKEGSEKVPLDPFTFEFSHETTDLCEEYDDCHEINLDFLQKTQNSWDGILQMSTKVYLNDIVRALGLADKDGDYEENVAVRRAGWLNPKYYDTPGDGHIDFRVTPVRYRNAEGKMRWKYMLNFNCDGDIEAMVLAQNGLFGKAKRKIDKH